MSTVAISKNNAAVMNNKVNMSNKTGWLSRLKNYMLSNASYFAASSCMMSGNAYAAGQIIVNFQK